MSEANKTVLVIGGSRGIGAAIVSRFASDGASVIFTYAGSTEASRALAKKTGAVAIQSDAADRAALIKVVAEVSPVDVLVVCAGLLLLGDPLQLDADSIDRMIDVNIRAPYYASVEAARTMPEGGRIILIGSTNGDRVPFPGASAYGMTKSALQGMARGLAHDFGARGITVNVVQPGPVDTDMNPADGAKAPYLHGFMAIKRHATAAEVASLVAYLAGPDAGGISGSMQNIDGGFAA
jgi:cyclic-di-GMP-binding biofilm dispersal mediator protein